jgi:hypothetical protein
MHAAIGAAAAAAACWCPCRDTFRCCGPADDADICVNNSTSPYPDPTPYEDEDNQHDFLSNLIAGPAATCKYTALTETCPDFVTARCAVVQLNW